MVVTDWRRTGTRFLHITYSAVEFVPAPIRRVERIRPLIPAECRGAALDWARADMVVGDFRGIDLRGWPMLAMWCVPADSGGTVSHDARFGLVIEGLRPSRRQWYQRVPTLPLLPLWRGFLVDTLFYAAIWWAVFTGFAQARRGIRSGRGRCMRCGYRLQSAERGCSECGHGRNEDGQDSKD